jgi:hypothetical protein
MTGPDLGFGGLFKKRCRYLVGLGIIPKILENITQMGWETSAVLDAKKFFVQTKTSPLTCPLA